MNLQGSICTVMLWHFFRANNENDSFFGGETDFGRYKKCTSIFKKKLGFTSCMTEQPLRGMELQKKKQKKIEVCRKYV